MQFSDPQTNFISVESRLSRSVMGLPEKEATKLIEQRGCLYFVQQRDKVHFQLKSPTAHSYRIKLTVRNGKVINTDIG